MNTNTADEIQALKIAMLELADSQNREAIVNRLALRQHRRTRDAARYARRHGHYVFVMR